ncbi:MAG: hypothetical protein AB7G23_03155 [Vicinamibacterales bacterium]
MVPHSVRIVTGALRDDEMAILQREAAAIVASVAPGAELRVDVASGEPALTLDGVAVRLREDRHRHEPTGAPAAMAWALFWALLERLPDAEAPARVACCGGLDPRVLAVFEAALGIRVVVAEETALPTHLAAGPRVVIDGLLSPVLDQADTARRGSRSPHGVLRRAAARLVGEPHALALLAQVERHRPQVADAMRRRLPVPLLTQIMRQLADENVPLTQPRLLCEALLATTSVCSSALDAFIVFEPPVLGLAWSDASLDALPAHAWTQRAREGLKTHNASRFSEQSLAFRQQWGIEIYGPEWTVRVGLIDPDVERRIGEGSLAAHETDALLATLAHELAQSGGPAGPVPLLVSASTRFAVWHLVRDTFPDVSVLAYQELAPEANIQPLFRLSL